jgi:uncharacterized membrane protein YedE/YeeE
MTDTLWPPAWPWWAGGLVIGLMVPLMYLLHNQALGVSTGYGSLIKLWRPGTRLGWFRSTFAGRVDWRVWFVAGMVLGAFAAARLAGRPLVTAEMGLFTASVGWSLPAKGLFFFAGGVLLAVGARIAGGCTSGHSIHGIANLHPSSIVATVFFMAFGALATWLVRVLVFGGGA